MFPFVSADSNELLFTRKVNNIDDELYKAQRDTCGYWLRAKNEGYPINSPDAELYQSYSADGHYQFITRCDTRSENGWSLGACDLLMAYRSDSFWCGAGDQHGVGVDVPACGLESVRDQ